jgi:hypothetical protein
MPQANSPKSPLRSLLCLPVPPSLRSRPRQRTETGFSSTSSGESGTSGSSGASSSRPSGTSLSPTVSAPLPLSTTIHTADENTDVTRGRNEDDKELDQNNARKKRIEAIMSGEPQIIPLHLTDPVDLDYVLERNFEPSEFRIEVRRQHISAASPFGYADT